MEPGISHTKLERVSLKALCTLEPFPSKDVWVVYTYVLNREIQTKEDTHGLLIVLGCCPNHDLAEKRARLLTQKTGQRMAIAQLGYWTELRLLHNKEHTTMIHADPEGKLVQFETQEFKHQQQRRQDQYEKEKALLVEQQTEMDPHSIAYYKHQWLRAIHNYAQMKEAEEKLENAQKVYETRVKAIRTHYSTFPDHDTEWLTCLGALDYTPSEMEAIEAGYISLRKEILKDVKPQCPPELLKKHSAAYSAWENAKPEDKETLCKVLDAIEQQLIAHTSKIEIPESINEEKKRIDSVEPCPTKDTWHVVGKNKRH